MYMEVNSCTYMHMQLVGTSWHLSAIHQSDIVVKYCSDVSLVLLLLQGLYLVVMGAELHLNYSFHILTYIPASCIVIQMSAHRHTDSFRAYPELSPSQVH